MSPIDVMKAFYRNRAPESVAFRQKNDNDWIHCLTPEWNFGVCDYKIIDLELDNYLSL